LIKPKIYFGVEACLVLIISIVMTSFEIFECLVDFECVRKTKKKHCLPNKQ